MSHPGVILSRVECNEQTQFLDLMKPKFYLGLVMSIQNALIKTESQ